MRFTFVQVSANNIKAGDIISLNNVTHSVNKVNNRILIKGFNPKTKKDFTCYVKPSTRYDIIRPIR